MLVESGIRDKIYTIRGKQVMLDRDIAKLYGIETRTLKQAVNRNLKRFPDDFMFVLNNDEADSLVSQSVIPQKKQLGGALPYVFTEQGVANLSSILKTDKAIEVNIKIMRTFVKMRRFLSNNTHLFAKLKYIDKKILEHDNKFDKIFDTIESSDLSKKQGIFYDGQIFDAHKFVCDLIASAKERIVLIDNYVDYSVLELFCKTSVPVSIYTRIDSRLRNSYSKFCLQYSGVSLFSFTRSHDRFLIIDSKVYHFGASLKDLGKKWFAFCLMEVDCGEVIERL